MIGVALAEQVEHDPSAAQVAFSRLDEALNEVLAGHGEHHARYARVGSIGLAAIIARDGATLDSYNPLDPMTPSRLSLSANNRTLRPETWEPLEADEEIIGGVIPNNIGRFTAFALAKGNYLLADANLASSYHADRISIAPGQVGYAGGRRSAGSLVILSGLWQIHDHVAGQLYEREIAAETENATAATRTADNLAAEIEQVFGDITLLHAGVEASDIGHSDLAALLASANDLVPKLAPAA